MVTEGGVDSSRGELLGQFSNLGVRKQTGPGATGNSKVVLMNIRRMEHMPRHKLYKE